MNFKFRNTVIFSNAQSFKVISSSSSSYLPRKDIALFPVEQGMQSSTPQIIEDLQHCTLPKVLVMAPMVYEEEHTIQSRDAGKRLLFQTSIWASGTVIDSQLSYRWVKQTATSNWGDEAVSYHLPPFTFRCFFYHLPIQYFRKFTFAQYTSLRGGGDDLFDSLLWGAASSMATDANLMRNQQEPEGWGANFVYHSVSQILFSKIK